MKVVIVKEIDEMPTDCDSCPFQDFFRTCGFLDEYTVENEWVEDAPYYDLKGKGDCPLRPLPHKLQADWYTDGYKEGFNSCLDEITGETE